MFPTFPAYRPSLSIAGEMFPTTRAYRPSLDIAEKTFLTFPAYRPSLDIKKPATMAGFLNAGRGGGISSGTSLCLTASGADAVHFVPDKDVEPMGLLALHTSNAFLFFRA
ncbi:hypothetical protein AT746_06115 [Lacimicrobium alkaliphilum]|uniref:Uncharacterized protein n=1 Tax=Lacimicrobium alkaliphilum TaxID=1526571 RepID=A0A0U2ZHN2_9ALTE|nr:hypothetical protein AT746_06115 [Lacimicrobium alkaliphilum]